jgi:hypothetical protein
MDDHNEADISPLANSKVAAPKTEKSSGKKETPFDHNPKNPATPLTKEEQMALYEKELKEEDWGHQPC